MTKETRMARQPQGASTPDPIAELAVGVAADHAAAKARGEDAGKEATQEAADAGAPADEAAALGEVVEGKVEEAVAGASDDAQASGGEPASSDAPVPPAPGDDAEAVFARRMERLQVAASEAEFESGSAFGDLRDCILDLFKLRPKLWSAMSESEQRDAVRMIEGVSRTIIDKIVLVVAEEDAETIHCTLTSQFSVKGETLEAKLKIEHVDNDVLQDVFKLSGHRVVLVSADAKRFMSARRMAQVDPDQLGMGFGDDAKAPARPAPQPTSASQAQPGPEGDDDLTGSDFGVFDTDDGGEWLVKVGDDDGDDEWSGNSGEAKRMSHAEATKVASEYDDGSGRFKARILGDDPAPEGQDDDDTGDD